MTTPMYCNVILTFETPAGIGMDTQEIFDQTLRIRKSETSCIDFINRELFPRIVKRCELLGRDHRDLMKISTASDWSLFERTTNLPSLDRLGHSCKWYFGTSRSDLDFWELDIMQRLGLGTTVTFDGAFTSEYFAQLNQKRG
jgi:hypothetical protein